MNRKTIQESLVELAWAVKTIPVEAADQWRQAHRWNREKGDYVIVPDGNHQSLIWIDDPDYVMWKRLGWITDALLLVIALTAIFLTGIAVGYVV